jgi:hypothetical protein
MLGSPRTLREKDETRSRLRLGVELGWIVWIPTGPCIGKNDSSSCDAITMDRGDFESIMSGPAKRLCVSPQIESSKLETRKVHGRSTEILLII